MTTTKLQNVLDFLKSKGTITKDEMRNECFYSNGGDAIKRLRDNGHKITTTWGETSTGAKYAIYRYDGFVALQGVA